MDKVRLFVYGKLQPRLYPPDTMTSYTRDTVTGSLYEIGNDPAIVDLGSGTQVIHGYTLNIHEEELPYLDKAEKGFRRTKIVTGNKVIAYIYVWDGKLPDKAHPIDKWPST